MKLGIMQPYFMPYIGYFQLIKAVDKYVIYDDVNYIKGGWINRNSLLISGDKKLFTIALQDASPYKLICEIEIKDDFQKLLKTIHLNYCKAPYYRDTMTLMERIFAFSDKNLAHFLAHSLQEVLSYLHINTEILISSDLHKDCSLKGKEKVLHICELLHAESYFNAIGGQELYDKAEFAQRGVDLRFLQSNIEPYKQLKGDFVPCLSMIDVLMYNSPETVNRMLDNYVLL